MRFLTEAGEKELDAAVAAIESVSAAEVVIAIRPHARHSLIQHGIVGIVSAIGMLAFTLYSPIEFTLWQILVLPIFMGIVGAVAVAAFPPLYRFVQPDWVRHEHVREAAYATFVEQGIHSTRDRTGILVYIAVRERMVEIVADLEVLRKVGIEVLAAWSGQLEGVLPQGANAVGKQLASFADELATALPRRADDIDELSNAVQVLGAPPRHRKAAS
jgi:putative membrane protein